MDKWEGVITLVNEEMRYKLHFRSTVLCIFYKNNLLDLHTLSVTEFCQSMVSKSYLCQGVAFLLMKIVMLMAWVEYTGMGEVNRRLWHWNMHNTEVKTLNLLSEIKEWIFLHSPDQKHVRSNAGNQKGRMNIRDEWIDSMAIKTVWAHPTDVELRMGTSYWFVLYGHILLM